MGYVVLQILHMLLTIIIFFDLNINAASGSTSLYAYGITSSTNDYNGATITLRLGFVKD